MYLYYGSDLFSLQVLEGLFEKLPPLAVVTQPDRPAGRNYKMKSGPLARFAKEHNLPLLQPKSLKDPEAQESVLSYSADLHIVVSFGQILPANFLTAAPPVLNAHASLLPKWRGASPIQSVLLAGEKESGVSIIRLTPPLDAGPVIAMKTVPVEKGDNHALLSEKLAELSIELLSPYITGTPLPAGEEQDHDAATFCGKITPEQAELHPLRESDEQCLNKIRAFSPKPGSFIHLEGKKSAQRLKILEAEVATAKVEPGTLVKPEKRRLLLGCSRGALKILRVQLEGKPAMPVGDFLNGWNRPFVISP